VVGCWGFSFFLVHFLLLGLRIFGHA
jgi:hypothetical protein